MSHLLEYVLIDSSIYLLHEMRMTCISQARVQGGGLPPPPPLEIEKQKKKGHQSKY